jgi:hypothetical protein
MTYKFRRARLRASLTRPPNPLTAQGGFMSVLAAIDSPPQLPPELLAKHGPALDAWFDRRFEHKLLEARTNKTPSLAIIATKGTLDWAYPPFILASRPRP